MAGSKRRFNVHGNIVMGDPEKIHLLQRLGSNELMQIFMHAKEQGQARVNLDEVAYTLQRHPDHTFTLEAGAAGHVVF